MIIDVEASIPLSISWAPPLNNHFYAFCAFLWLTLPVSSRGNLLVPFRGQSIPIISRSVTDRDLLAKKSENIQTAAAPNSPVLAQRRGCCRISLEEI